MLRGAREADGLKPDPREGQGRYGDRERVIGPDRHTGVSGQDSNVSCQRERKRRCGIGKCPERWRFHRYSQGSLQKEQDRLDTDKGRRSHDAPAC